MAGTSGSLYVMKKQHGITGEGDDVTTRDWVAEMEAEVERNDRLNNEQRGAWERHSIYKLPQGFVLDEKRLQAYKPKVVSLGPYHYGEEQVKAMEGHKRRALRRFLLRSRTNNRSLNDYREALKGGRGGELKLLMDSYKDLDEKWREDEEGFLKMMIMDGCFVMEVMKTDKILRHRQQPDYDASDPIFSYYGMLSNVPRIKRDMLMIENQIPLLVLHRLRAVQMGVTAEQAKEWVNNLVLELFDQETREAPATNTNTSTTAPASTAMPPTTIQDISSEPLPPPACTDDHGDADVQDLHVLDVVRKSMIRDPRAGATHGRRFGGGIDVIWPATRLKEAGIKFQKSWSPSLKDITFQATRLGRDATLSLPQMVVHDATESKFLNLMAFEHLHVGSGKEVSSYVSFMDNIIDSDKDVSLLSQYDIIKNFVGTDQAVADLFNGICHDVSIDPDSILNRVHRQVTRYCNHPRNKHCANLKHTYFNTPWSVVAFVAATFALVITIIQFVYALLSYYKHKA